MEDVLSTLSYWLELNTSRSIFSSSLILCSTKSCSFIIYISLVSQLSSSALVFSAYWTFSTLRQKSCAARVAFMRATVFFVSLALGDLHSNSKLNELIPEDQEEPFDSKSNCRVFGFAFSSMEYPMDFDCYLGSRLFFTFDLFLPFSPI